MRKVYLSVSYSDVFEIAIDYSLDKKYLTHEISESFDINNKDEIDIFDVYPHRSQLPRGFGLLSYGVSSAIEPDYNSIAYELYFGDKARGNTEISKSEAMKVVDFYNMTLVAENEYGKIWE